MPRLLRRLLAALSILLFVSPACVHAVDKLQPPAADRQTASQKIVRDAYRPEEARTPAARKALAARMLKEAADTDAAGRFVLLNESARLGAAGGDLAVATRAIDELDAAYVVDPWVLRVACLRAALDAAATPKDAAALVPGGIAFADAAIAAGHIKAAEQVLPLVERLAAKAADKAIQDSVRQRQAYLRELRQAEAGVAVARKTLAANATNAEANLVVGRFECLLRGDWARGLPNLAMGSDAALAALAKRDLATPPESNAKAMKEVADGWWTASVTRSGLAKARMQARAADWYSKAIGDLKGLDKAVAERRIAETGESGSRGVDVLKLVGGRAKTDWGTWEMTPEGLACTKSGRALLPYVPPEEYDLRVVFTRHSGSDSLAIFCPLAKGTLLCIAAGAGTTTISFANMTGRNDWHFMGKDERKDKSPNEVPYTFTIRVRKTGVQAALNDQVIEMATDGTGYRNDALTMGGELVLALHTQGTATFSAIEITEILGKGHPIKE